eukprot:2571744-Prymnesium_polylepis.1
MAGDATTKGGSIIGRGGLCTAGGVGRGELGGPPLSRRWAAAGPPLGRRWRRNLKPPAGEAWPNG